MNLETQNIFIVGPGSVGKSTVSKILAEKIGYQFVDIDFEFCDRIAMIPDYIRDYSYSEYSSRNSELFEELLCEFPSKTVFPLSSSFLVHEDSPEVIKRNLQLVSLNGITILLLPTGDPEAIADLIVKRQKKRFPEVNDQQERERFISRYHAYQRFGDLKIFSSDSPDEIAQEMLRQLQDIGLELS